MYIKVRKYQDFLKNLNFNSDILYQNHVLYFVPENHVLVTLNIREYNLCASHIKYSLIFSLNHMFKFEKKNIYLCLQSDD